MIRLAANLTTLFNDLPFLERFAAARACGFEGVELLFPYAHAPELLRSLLARHRLELVQFNLPPGDWEGGERGLAVDPRRRDAFRASVDVALQYARAVGVRQLHCMAGIVPPSLGAEAAHATYVDNLRHAAAAAAPHGIRIMIEPINTFDMPGYFLAGSAQAAAIIAEAGADNVFLQFDLYHMQRMEGQLEERIALLLPLIRHMQLADVPGRHEPGTGTIDWKRLFAHIDQLGYGGWIGCEYFPAADTRSGLGWREQFL
jgi:hydroxypyruvate isomerase